ncbi:MAG: STAS domain-containing protein [Thermoanaerobaculum sp.]|nr:STAS domain-containing protein [Thermoanaerobaculum sp.]
MAVLSVAGYINNEGGEAIAAAARSILGEGKRAILLDLEQTRIINSIGISLLLEVLEACLDSQVVLAFCHLHPSVAKTFQVMGLAQYARLYPSREAALAELSQL